MDNITINDNSILTCNLNEACSVTTNSNFNNAADCTNFCENTTANAAGFSKSNNKCICYTNAKFTPNECETNNLIKEIKISDNITNCSCSCKTTNIECETNDTSANFITYRITKN